MSFFKYVVTNWNEIEDKKEKNRGFICAENYGDAASSLEKVYGKDLILIEGLYEMETFDNVFEISEDDDDKTLFTIKISPAFKIINY